MILKLTIFVALLTIAVASPSPHHGKGGISKGHRRYCYKGNRVFGCFGYFARGVNRKCGHSYSIFNELSNYKNTGDFESSTEALLLASKGSCDIIDNQWPGLGGIFQKMIISSHRILFCVPSLWRRKHRCGVCDREYGKRWGWGRYEGKYDKVDDVINEYNLYDASSQVNNILRKHNNRGIDGLDGTKKVVAKYIWELSNLFDRNYSWRSDDFYKIFYRQTAIVAALANGRRSGLGDYVVDGFIKYCGTSIKEYGYPDVSSCDKDIKKEIEGCSLDDFNKAITCSSGEGEGDDNDNENNNNNNNQNNNKNDLKNTNSNSNSDQNNNSANSSSNNQNQNEQKTNVIINQYFADGDRDGNNGGGSKKKHDVDEIKTTVIKEENSNSKNEASGSEKQRTASKQESSADSEKTSVIKGESSNSKKEKYVKEKASGDCDVV